MTKQDFKNTKTLLKRTMEYNLKIALKNNKSSFDYCYEAVDKTITIKHDEKHEAIQGKLEYITAEIAKGTPYTIFGMTEQPHCTVRSIGTYYTFKHRQLREEITARQVEQRMKNLIRNKIREDTDNKYRELDCRVMDLFKRGIISWSEVIISHQVECSY